MHEDCWASLPRTLPTWCGSVLGGDLPRHGAPHVEEEIHSGRNGGWGGSRKLWLARVCLGERRVWLCVRAFPSRSATPRFSPLFFRVGVGASERHRSRAHTSHSMPSRAEQRQSAAGLDLYLAAAFLFHNLFQQAHFLIMRQFVSAVAECWHKMKCLS